MPVELSWKSIAVRLLLTVLAGWVIGFNRGEHGRPAGMRTTLLVCLAASLSMILANAMMDSNGKTHDSFVVLDLMRLPLDVLSGMGFIGAGTIIRRGNLVLGITTTAMLWYVTMMGMCFGAGQNGLGLVALALGLLALWGLKHIESRIPQDCHGTFALTLAGDVPTDAELISRSPARIAGSHPGASRSTVSETLTKSAARFKWRPPAGDILPPPIVSELRNNPAIQFAVLEAAGNRQ